MGLIILEALPSAARLRSWLALTVFLLALLFGVSHWGLFSTDEPRYAAIGRAMAATGDWITPKLWGQPWFEKPPLLYWMTAVGFRAGLGEETAPRVPVALVSAGLLAFLFLETRREYGERAAWFAAGMLATSAGWLAYSRVAVTDLPMAACFTAAWMLAARPGRRPACAAGALLALAVLAKALVPLVLFVPAAWHMRRRAADLFALAGCCAIVALPWFALCFARNGMPFLDDLIWKQHFARFATGALQHVQPWWFYVPVLLAGFFPWTPVLALAGGRGLYGDARLRLSAGIVVFGFVFFSIARNKLPGYLLPLMPAAALVAGVALDRAGRSAAAVALSMSALLLALLVWLRSALRPALESGLTHVSFHVPAWAWVAAGVCAAAAAALSWANRRSWAAGMIATAVLASFFVFLRWDLPEIDRAASGRWLWVHQLSRMKSPCLSNVSRGIRYGAEYYAGRQLPPCPGPESKDKVAPEPPTW